MQMDRDFVKVDLVLTLQRYVILSQFLLVRRQLQVNNQPDTYQYSYYETKCKLPFPRSKKTPQLNTSLLTNKSNFKPLQYYKPVSPCIFTAACFHLL